MPPPSTDPRGVNEGRKEPSQMWISVCCWGNLNKYFVNISSISLSSFRKTIFCSHFSMFHTPTFVVLGTDDTLVKSDFPCYSSLFFSFLFPFLPRLFLSSLILLTSDFSSYPISLCPTLSSILIPFFGY